MTGYMDWKCLVQGVKHNYTFYNKGCKLAAAHLQTASVYNHNVAYVIM